MPAFHRMLVVLVALVGLIPAAGRAQTFEFYVSIEGTKQGTFANESVRGNHMPRLVGLKFDYLVKTPRDPVTGLATGKRQHGPVVFTKEWGAASPQLFQALVTNEILKSVVFEFYQTNQEGEEVVSTLVKLTNAAVAEIHQHSPTTGNQRQLEDISFTFGAIEIQHLPGKTIAMDSWTALR